MDDGAVPKPKKPARKAKVLGVGADGRNLYTADRDARAGHRSATNSRPAGPYVGYELHLAVQARDVRWTNYVDKVSLSDEVPGVITCLSLVPAGTHRGRAIVDDLVAAKTAGRADRRCGLGSRLQPVLSRAPPITSWPRPASTRPSSPSPTSAAPARSPATPCSSTASSTRACCPNELRDLPDAAHGARPRPSKVEHEAKFNLRARWRMVRHAGPDGDGATRWRCPFCAGLLRARQLPQDHAPGQDRPPGPRRRGMRAAAATGS